jgi:rhodanese-related sulfurtransferase
MHRLCASLQRLAERGVLVESDDPDPLLAPEKPMSTSEQLLANARQRGQTDSLPYAGAVTPEEAYSLLQANANVKLIDVRTQAERDWVGRVILPDAQHLAAQWTLYPGGAPNSEFLRQLEQQAQRSDTLLFLCRSGVRSRYAAKLATENGFEHCFDILEGFEGDRNEQGHRKSIAGWCMKGLPWVGA